ncbi:ABC transporter substrate-binding protein [Cohnella yongneupensis]|uniref:ABC transporter substrate-binding protein n=1 Tax=Cohnella yongneupensis TaxID=425006 RepID=A0ABW0QWE0_9BACL
MTRLRKGSTLALSTLLVAGLALTGCSNNNNDSAGNSPGVSPSASPTATETAQPSASATPETKALDPYEVVMVYPDAPQKDDAAVQGAINDYLKSTYPDLNMTVKLNPIDWGSWGDKTNLMMASGDKFDLFFTAGWLGFETQVNKGGLLPLDDLLAQYGPDIEAVEKDYHDAARRQGKIYGVHTHQELGNQQGIAFNKELVDKYKFDLSVLKSGNLKDLEPMLKTIKENEPGVTPFVGPAWPLDAYFGSSTLDEVTGGYGIDVNTDASNFTVTSKYDMPRFKELASLTRDWFQAGYINKDGTTQGLDIWQKFKAKKAFATMADMEIVADSNIGEPKPMPSRSAQTGIDIIQVPLNTDRLQTGKLTATMQTISKTSEDPARAMMLLNLFYKDQKLLTLFNFGIEGTHYVLKDGQVALPDGKSQDSVGYYHDIMWQIGNQMLNYTRQGEDPNKYKNYESFNQLIAQKQSRLFGFVFDSAPVQNELIAIDNVKKEFEDGIKSGQMDPDKNLPKFIDKMKAAGSDKVIQEAQKQVDAWRAANGK